ncbi:MAG: glycosyltransferase [Rhodanobacteraceae bacterium]|nr:MAG: glycosyltransferase [Rhodanobacteraceae bacterium]
MNALPSVEAAVLATVTVTFNPDIPLLKAQLQALPRACVKVIVDNASRPALVTELETVTANVRGVHLLCNDTNTGLAAAINRGVKAVSKLPLPPRFVLLLDQDSEPQPGSVETLISAFQTLETEGQNVGCVGPLLRDPHTGLTHGFHQCTRWRWKRVYPPAGSPAPVPCANLNGSGTLVPVSLFLELGGLDEPLFIDHVDTEWAFRVLARGYGLWGIPSAVFVHRMGEDGRRFWLFGWRVWPARSPRRHYYLYRNAVTLMRRTYVPNVWKLWAVVKMFLTVIITATFGPLRCRQLRNMCAGAWAGLVLRGPVDE